MVARIYVFITAGIISMVGLLHLFRIVFHAPVVIGSLRIPMFLSYFGLAGSVGIVVLALLAWRKI